jgi:hypothetical protein
MPLDVAKIRDGLRFLRKADSRLIVFGADSHKYRLRRCIDEAKILEFEERFSIRLPDDYRVFLTELGNGGAGPFYGILGLDQFYESADNSWGALSKPFPYSERWKGPPELLKAIDECNDDRLGELIDEYWRNTRRDGSIAICEYGCALRFLLVVNGSEYGNIWFDRTSDMAGFSPVGINPEAPLEPYGNWCLANDESAHKMRVGFAEWYCCWLDWACRLVNKQA